MNQELSHILEESVCLSRRQLADYIGNRLEAEELHAVETHLLSCPLCAMAAEGLTVSPEEGLAALSTLNSDFLQEHFERNLPQIHLNSVVPAALPSAQVSSRRRNKASIPLVRSMAAAAAVLLCAWGLWALSRQFSRNDRSEAVIASRYEAPQPVPAPASAQSAPTTREEEADMAQTRMAAPQLTEGTGTVAEVAPAVPLTAAPSTQEVKTPAPPTPRPQPGNALGAATGNAYYNAPETSRMTSDEVVEDARGSAPSEEVATATPVKKQTSSRAAAAPESSTDAPSADERLSSAQQFYDRGDYNAAIKESKIASGAGDAGVKDEASLVSARSYIRLGEKEKARAILLRLKDKSGSTGRQARRLLNRLDQ